MNRVGVIGLGAMGSRIAGRLLGAGHEVVVWNRSPERTRPLVERGALSAASPAEAATRVQTLITMVADPAALRAVSEGDAGVAAGAHEELLVIAMSTVGPGPVAELVAALPAGTALLDAPVLGSTGEAEAGALTIFVGGPTATVDGARPLLSALGSPVAVGALGSGQAAKLVANATLFATLGALGEAIALARGLGLSADAARRVLAATPLAAQAERRWGAIEDGRYPARFALALARKDAELIAQGAAGAGVELRLAAAARAWLADAVEDGWGGHDYTSMLATILARQGDRDRGWIAAAGPAPGRPLAYDGLIVDLDGVIWLAGDPIPGAAATIERLRASGVRVLFLTNDPQSSRDEHAARLASIGIPATAADVLTSSAAAARFLAAREGLAGGDLLAIGSAALRAELAQAGFHLLPSGEARRAPAVVVGGHRDFDYGELRAATEAVSNGAELYATGRDAVFPTPDGPWPATGAILAAVETATGVEATVVGKPEPFVFEIAREALAGCERVAVIGDHLVADVAGAKRAGLEAILVLTGTATEDDLARAAIKPDLVLPSLAALQMPR